MEFALVYQYGIANVFEFRGDLPRLVVQHAFSACEWYCRGAKAAGAKVRVFHCDQTGNIVNVPWSAGPGTMFADKKTAI